MTLQDPIADLLTRIRNGYMARKDFVLVPFSKLKLKIIIVLKKEFFLDDYSILNDDSKSSIKICLKYYGNKIPIVRKINRISKPGRRVYIKTHNIKKVLNGFGISIISTPIGLLTDQEAKKLGHGGEILCSIE
jgi:small subunit ribosomal protein S8